ncbi:MAG: hypothetical protein LBL34_02145 [Clostridiales bacterium]|jgi:hypothetical protein|nr:hypothetical protein [Clostridiales bacterium]
MAFIPSKPPKLSAKQIEQSRQARQIKKDIKSCKAVIRQIDNGEFDFENAKQVYNGIYFKYTMLNPRFADYLMPVEAWGTPTKDIENRMKSDMNLIIHKIEAFGNLGSIGTVTIQTQNDYDITVSGGKVNVNSTDNSITAGTGNP